MLGHKHLATQLEGSSGVPSGGGREGQSGNVTLICFGGPADLGRGRPPPSVHFAGAEPPNSAASAPKTSHDHWPDKWLERKARTWELEPKPS